MNILLSSVGRENCMVEYFKRALGNSGKVFASNPVMTHAMMLADGYVVVPYEYDMAYVRFLIEFCKSKDISAIISLSDIDLLVLTEHLDEFTRNNIYVVVSERSIIDTCNDKWETFQFLTSIGVKQPRSYIDLELVKQDVRASLLSFPLILKPRWGMDGIGVTRIDTVDELDIFYRKVHQQIFNSSLKYLTPKEEKSIIIQEKIEGEEFVISILNDLNGEYIVNTVLHKIVALGSETNIAQIVDHHPFESVRARLSSNLKHMANMDVDCFLTESGEIIVLEMNCRFGHQYPFVHLSNVDFPRQIIEWLQGIRTSDVNIRPEIGVKGCKESPFPILFDFDESLNKCRT